MEQMYTWCNLPPMQHSNSRLVQTSRSSNQHALAVYFMVPICQQNAIWIEDYGACKVAFVSLSPNDLQERLCRKALCCLT